MTCSNCNVLRTLKVLIMLSFLLTCPAGCGDTQDRGTRSDPPEAPVTADVADHYPLKTCVVSGEPLDEFGDPVIERYDGREVRFCCTDCVDAFRQAPTQYMALLDAGARGADHKDHTHHDH